MKCLWITAIIAGFNGIWFAQNSSLHGHNMVPISSMFSFNYQSIQEANSLQTGQMHNTVQNLCIIHRSKVTLRLPKAPTNIYVIWSLPERGWINVNVDGASNGNPSLSGEGGIFRYYKGFTKGCFAILLGSLLRLSCKLLCMPLK